MELIQGCQNNADLHRVNGLLKISRYHWPTVADCQRAFADFTRYRLSHNLGLLDSLIGQTAVGLGVPLARFNLKDFALVSGLTTIQPY